MKKQKPTDISLDTTTAWLKKFETIETGLKQLLSRRLIRDRELQAKLIENPNSSAIYGMRISVNEVLRIACRARRPQRRQRWIMAVIALMREEQGGNPGEWSSPQNVLKRVHAYDATGFVITDPVLHKLLYLIHCSEAQFLVNRAKKAAISRWKRAPKKNIKKPS